MVALLGANGAGKTPTLRAICHMGVKTRGTIRFAGRRIDGMPTENIVRLGIGHIPEGRGTFLSLTAGVDAQTIAAIEQNGVESFLEAIQAELRENAWARTSSGMPIIRTANRSGT